jgi:uncharacterized OB-fold protein
MTEYNKPLPKVNSDNREFWTACRDHLLKFQKCLKCGHIRWPPALVCPKCHSGETGWIIAKGYGRIYTFVVYHVAYLPEFEKDIPYVAATVELDEGPHLLTNVVCCPPDQVFCGMPVEVTWEDITKEFSLPKFKPLDH